VDCGPVVAAGHFDSIGVTRSELPELRDDRSSAAQIIDHKPAFGDIRSPA
jgi:hypothetical protein